MSTTGGGGLLNGRYELRSVAGSGGMATVWRAWDRVLARDVAIKVLKQEVFHEYSREQLRNEAQAAARLSHQHVAAVHDFIEEHDGPEADCFVVMEFVEGRTVAEVIRVQQRLNWLRATTVAAQTASALAYAHRRGVVHRDVSSTNIMLTDDGVKVLDFGIAATPEHASDSDAPVLGTPAYVAPERIRDTGQAAGPAADVYALGVVWYRMLTGEMPWAARGNAALLQAHLMYTPAPLPPIQGMPDELRELCLACLAKNPADRPDSAYLAGRLAAYTTTSEPNTITLRLPSPQRRRNVLAGAGMVALALLAAGVLYTASRDNQTQVTETPPAVVSTPSPKPSLSQTSTAPTPKPAESPRDAVVVPAQVQPRSPMVIEAVGGSVRVTCDSDDRAIVASLRLASGFELKNHDPGPSSNTQTVMVSADHESEIRARCSGGVATGSVREKDLDSNVASR